MQVRYTSDVRTFQVMNFFFQYQGVHKIAKKTCGSLFSIFDVKYFFSKRTAE